MKEQLADGYNRRQSFCPNPKISGLCLFEKKEITIFMRRKKHRNPRELLDTIIHEEIHALHPDLPEKKTKKSTEKIIGELTLDQIGYFFGLYGIVFDQNPALETGI
ncbi:MAG: hypothetical protein AABX29_09400 [Nanoarchaeota archaeon]